MTRAIQCPQCRAPIRPGEQSYEGAVVTCPSCKSMLKLVANQGGRTATIPASGPGGGPPLPPRAPVPNDAPAGRKSRTPGKAGAPRPEHSRNTIAVVLLMGVAGLALLFISWYVRTVQTLTTKADRAAAHRVAEVESGFQKPKPKQKQTPKETPQQQTGLIMRQLVVERPVAPATVQVGTLVIGVASAEVAPVRIGGNASPSRYLTLTLRVTNLADKPVNYTGWQYATGAVLLKDTDRNYYNRIRFAPGEHPDGCVESAVIQPAETIKDVLVFEPPSVLNRNLELDLPLSEESVFRFVVPLVMMLPRAAPKGQLIVRQPAGTTPAPSSTAPNGAQPDGEFPKPSPTQNPTLRRTIIAEYREQWGQVERRAKGMSYDRGRQFKRTRRTEILDGLSEKYKVTVDDLRSILP